MKLANRIAALGVLGLVCLGGIGCDNAPPAVKKAEEAAMEKGKEALAEGKKLAKEGEEAVKKGVATAEKMTEEAWAKAKEEYAKHTSLHLDSIQQKIKELTGDAATEAQALYEKAKEKAQSIKDTAPEKFEEFKKEFSDLVADLKTKLGITN